MSTYHEKIGTKERRRGEGRERRYRQFNIRRPADMSGETLEDFCAPQAGHGSLSIIDGLA